MLPRRRFIQLALHPYGRGPTDARIRPGLTPAQYSALSSAQFAQRRRRTSKRSTSACAMINAFCPEFGIVLAVGIHQRHAGERRKSPDFAEYLLRLRSNAACVAHRASCQRERSQCSARRQVSKSRRLIAKRYRRSSMRRGPIRPAVHIA